MQMELYVSNFFFIFDQNGLQNLVRVGLFAMLMPFIIAWISLNHNVISFNVLSNSV